MADTTPSEAQGIEAESKALFALGRPQVRAALAFVATVLVALVAVNATGLQFMNPRGYLRSTLSLYSYHAIEEPYDVVMVGSSRMDYAMDSRIVAATLEEELGEPVRVYKLAQHGLRPWLLYSVLREFVQDIPPRRLLVVGMGLQFFNDQGAKPAALKQVGSIREFAAFPARELTSEQWAALLQLPFRGVQVMWNMDWAFDPSVLRMRDYQATHGGELSPELEAELSELERYYFLRRMISAGRYDVLPKRDERLDIEPFNEVRDDVVYDMDNYWFTKVLDLLEEMPCEVMLVRTPVKSKFLQSITKETRDEFHRVIAKDIRRRGFTYHNLNRTPYPRKAKYFGDVVHMTPEGRQITSETFAREILAPALREQRGATKSVRLRGAGSTGGSAEEQ